jgi:hypothetical protein
LIKRETNLGNVLTASCIDTLEVGKGVWDKKRGSRRGAGISTGLKA